MIASDPTPPLRERDELALLVTDSGLGGLAVVADLERRARATGRYRRLDLDFVSALGETGQGYNKMPSRARQLAVFDAALAGMTRLVAADLLLVACNTLSVLIPDSRVLAAAPLPVLGIVELGVAAIAERLAADPTAVVVLFATETTIAAGAHREQLLGRGIAPERVLPLACPGLASAIELEGASPGVAAAIAGFARVAMARLPGGESHLIAGLGCSHYGYCAAEFEAGLRAAGAARVEVVDPNRRMSAALFPADGRAPHAAPRVRVRVVSRALPLPGEVAATAALLEPVSVATAAALRACEIRRDLFPFAGLTA